MHVHTTTSEATSFSLPLLSSCLSLSNSLLQLIVINYMFGRSLSNQQTKTYHSSLLTLCSACALHRTVAASIHEHVWADGTCFLFGSLFCRRKHKGRGHPICPQGFRLPYQHLCQRTARLDLPHSKVLWNSQYPQCSAFVRVWQRSGMKCYS